VQITASREYLRSGEDKVAHRNVLAREWEIVQAAHPAVESRKSRPREMPWGAIFKTSNTSATGLPPWLIPRADGFWRFPRWMSR
jgi:hypothetical protein